MANRFSVASYSFHGLQGVGAMNIFHYFETVKYRYNLNTADIWNGMLTSYGEKYLKLVKQQMDEHGLDLVNLCCDGAHLWSDDEKEAEFTNKRADECLNAAAILGAETIRFDVGIGGREATDEQIEYVAKKFDKYCERAARFGAKVGPENHWGASTNIEVMRKLIQAVKAENFGILLHLGNWQMSGVDFEKGCEYDLEMIPHAMYMHIHYEACENAEVQLPPLQEADYTGCWGIESHKSSNEYNNVAYQLSQVKRVVTPLIYKAERREIPEEFQVVIRKMMQK